MLKSTMNWALGVLSAQALGINQVEAYQGQFEDPEDTTIFPPTAFVAVDMADNTATEDNGMEPSFSLSVYLVTPHVHGTSTDDILDLVWSVVQAMHAKPVRFEADATPSVPPDTYIGRCFWAGANWMGIYPGFSTYRLSFKVKR